MEKLFLCQKFDTLFWNFIDMGEVHIMDEKLKVLVYPSRVKEQ